MADENPYAPPATSVEAHAPAPTGFRPMAGLGRAFGALMLGLVLVDAMSCVNATIAIRAMHRVLNDEPWERSELEAIDARGRVAQVTSVGLHLAAAVLFCVFMPRANRNARAFGAPMLRYSPGWAAGSMFIPIWSLYGPYEAMKEIWRHSDPDPNTTPSAVPTPRLLAWWWGLFLGSNFVSQISSTIVKTNEQGAQAVINSNYAVIVSAAALIPAALVAAAAFGAVARRQDQAASTRTTFVPAIRS